MEILPKAIKAQLITWAPSVFHATTDSLMQWRRGERRSTIFSLPTIDLHTIKIPRKETKVSYLSPNQMGLTHHWQLSYWKKQFYFFTWKSSQRMGKWTPVPGQRYINHSSKIKEETLIQHCSRISEAYRVNKWQCIISRNLSNGHRTQANNLNISHCQGSRKLMNQRAWTTKWYSSEVKCISSKLRHQKRLKWVSKVTMLPGYSGIPLAIFYTCMMSISSVLFGLCSLNLEVYSIRAVFIRSYW